MKAYLKGTKLPPAPNPTKAVRAKEKPIQMIGLLDSPVQVTERQKKMNQGRRFTKGGWKDDETKILIKMCRAGHDYHEISKHLPDRTEDAVQSKITRLRRKGVL